MNTAVVLCLAEPSLQPSPSLEGYTAASMVQAVQLRNAVGAEAAAAEPPKGELLRVAPLAGDAAQAKKRGREPA